MRRRSVVSLAGLWVLALSGLVFTSGSAPAGEAPSLAGVWRVVEVRTVSEGMDHTELRPGPALYIFTRKHYSMMSVPGRGPRKESAAVWEPTGEEKVAAFDSFVGNSGTYELTESVLTVFPAVSKTPEYTGGRGVFTYRQDGDSLWLTATAFIARGGAEDPWPRRIRSTTRLERIERLDGE